MDAVMNPVTSVPIDRLPNAIVINKEYDAKIDTKPFEISEDTLSMIKSSAENYKKGIVSEPIDLNEFDISED